MTTEEIEMAIRAILKKIDSKTEPHSDSHANTAHADHDDGSYGDTHDDIAHANSHSDA